MLCFRVLNCNYWVSRYIWLKPLIPIWNNQEQLLQIEYISNVFNICNDVKQGGVVSPMLFTVYIDDFFFIKVEIGPCGLLCWSHVPGIYRMVMVSFFCAWPYMLFVTYCKQLNRSSEEFNIRFNLSKSQVARSVMLSIIVLVLLPIERSLTVRSTRAMILVQTCISFCQGWCWLVEWNVHISDG